MEVKPETTTSSSASASASPLDLDKLRLSQDFASSLGVKKLITTVPVRKPNRQEFVRVHPDEDFRLQTRVLELKDDRSESYLVAPELWPELAEEATPKVLYATINRQNVVSLWPIRLPNQDGRIDLWSQSAMDAASRAAGKWVRVAANMSLGAYDIYEATAELPPPTWPEASFAELLGIAFKGRYIDRLDHPVIRRLRGAA